MNTKDRKQFVSVFIKFIIQNTYGNINYYLFIITLNEKIKFQAEFIISYI